MAASGTMADLVLVGGKVRTPAHPSGFAQALAVRGGAILAVGDEEEVRELTVRGRRVPLTALAWRPAPGCSAAAGPWRPSPPGCPPRPTWTRSPAAGPPSCRTPITTAPA